MAQSNAKRVSEIDRKIKAERDRISAEGLDSDSFWLIELLAQREAIRHQPRNSRVKAKR